MTKVKLDTNRYLKNLHKSLYGTLIRKSSKRQSEYQLTQDEFKRLLDEEKIEPATLSQTMGPNWRDIYWTPSRRPYVLKRLNKNLVRVCMYCRKVFGEKEPFEDRSQTHGICEECMPGVLLNMLDEMNKMRRQRGERELTMEELEEEKEHVR